jgi:hypothetical protein
MFNSSIAKILISVLFLKIMLIMDFEDFLFLDFFTVLSDLLPNSRGTSADLRVTPVYRGTPVEIRCPRRKFSSLFPLCKGSVLY